MRFFSPSLYKKILNFFELINILNQCILWLRFPILSNKNCGFPGSSDGRKPACIAGHPGSTPGSGRSPGEGNGNPLQYYCLKNPVDRGAWQATVPVLRVRLSTQASKGMTRAKGMPKGTGRGEVGEEAWKRARHLSS